MIRSASLGPWRGRTHTVGVTDVGAGTDDGSPGVQFGITDLTVTQYDASG
ncbi:hypothetical protein MAHJHV33_50170 [Mycobacterium avium subsp. hominissuis]